MTAPLARLTRLTWIGAAILVIVLSAINCSSITSFVSDKINCLSTTGTLDCLAMTSSKRATAGSIRIDVYDGSRRPLPQGTQLLVRIIDGNQKTVVERYYSGPSLLFTGLPFHDNFQDDYTVIVWARGFNQAGFTPVKIKPGTTPVVELMLLPSKYSIDFSEASWNVLKQSDSQLWMLLNKGARNEKEARQRYERLLNKEPLLAACLLNIVTALAETRTEGGSALLPYLREILFNDQMRKDRFYAYADATLVDELRKLSASGAFGYEQGHMVFHPGSTVSFKQRLYGEANLHLTFYENDFRTIDGVKCVKVEIDIDYYRDEAAHAILEVIPHLITGGASDPRTVYQLRWIAARRAGGAFEPPYRIIPAAKGLPVIP